MDRDGGRPQALVTAGEDHSPVSMAQVRARAETALAPSTSQGIGAEVEWLVFDLDDLARPITAATTAAIADGALPAGGRVTIEPGGQLELVTTPWDDPNQLADAIDRDTSELVDRFAAAGLGLVSLGLDPIRSAERSLDAPRYQAMEEFFRARSPVGLEMMSRTASLQLNVGLGSDPEETWRRAEQVVPVLAAMFANSPTVGSDRTEASRRQQIWLATDPTRTAPVPVGVDGWQHYVLASQVMLRHGDGTIRAQIEDLSFAEWLESADPPTSDELDLHLTTLFPPIRPRGFLEIRPYDAMPRAGRLAAIGATWVLLTDPDVSPAIDELCLGTGVLWRRSAAEGIADSELRSLGVELLHLAAGASDDRWPALAEACRSWVNVRTQPLEHIAVDQLVTSLVERNG